MKHVTFAFLTAVMLAIASPGCSTKWSLGADDQAKIAEGGNTGKVVGELTGLPGGGVLGTWIGTGIATLLAGFGVYKHGKDKGWDEAAGKPAVPPGAGSPVAAEAPAVVVPKVV